MVYIGIAVLLSMTLSSLALAAEYRPASVVCRGPLPFGTEQLLAAINLRLPLMSVDLKGQTPAVEVRALPPQRVTIQVGSSRRVISLAGLSRADAARVVALLALDLISHHQRPSPSQPAETAAVAPGRLFMGLSPRLAVGASEWSAAFEPTLDLGWMVSRRWLLFIEVGFTWTTEGEDPRQLTLTEVPLRLGAGFRHGWFEVRAALALRPYLVTGAGEDQGVLVGGGLGFHFRRRLRRWLVGYAAVGADLLSSRKEFRVGGETTLVTGGVVPWLGIGAVWQGG